jgi:hypothetical protein
MLPHALLKVTTLSNILFAIIPIFQGLNAAPVSSVISLGKYVVAVAVAAAVEACRFWRTWSAEFNPA